MDHYDNQYSFDALRKAARELKFVSADEIYLLYTGLEDIRKAVKKNSQIDSWNDKDFEKPIDCLGTLVTKFITNITVACKLSLILSTNTTIQIIAHLSETLDSENLSRFAECIIEQTSIIRPNFNFPFIHQNYLEISCLEEQVDKMTIATMASTENTTAGIPIPNIPITTTLDGIGRLGDSSQLQRGRGDRNKRYSSS